MSVFAINTVINKTANGTGINVNIASGIRLIAADQPAFATY